MIANKTSRLYVSIENSTTELKQLVLFVMTTCASALFDIKRIHSIIVHCRRNVRTSIKDNNNFTSLNQKKMLEVIDYYCDERLLFSSQKPVIVSDHRWNWTYRGIGIQTYLESKVICDRNCKGDFVTPSSILVLTITHNLMITSTCMMTPLTILIE